MRFTTEELVQSAVHGGRGILTEDGTGIETRVSYNITLYTQVTRIPGHAPIDGERSLDGSVWVVGDQFWARRVLGKCFTLTFQDGRRKMHLSIIDSNGRIGSMDGRGIHEL